MKLFLVITKAIFILSVPIFVFSYFRPWENFSIFFIKHNFTECNFLTEDGREIYCYEEGQNVECSVAEKNTEELLEKVPLAQLFGVPIELFNYNVCFDYTTKPELQNDKNFIIAHVPSRNFSFDSGNHRCLPLDPMKNEKITLGNFGNFVCFPEQREKCQNRESYEGMMAAYIRLQHPYWVSALLFFGTTGVWWGWLKIAKEVFGWLNLIENKKKKPAKRKK